MPEQRRNAPQPWQFPVLVEDVPEEGQHFDLSADADTRAAVARLAGLRDLPRLEASFDVMRHGGDGLRVLGRVSATVGQVCVITLEPLTNEVDEAVDLVFAPQPAPPAVTKAVAQAAPRTASDPDDETVAAGAGGGGNGENEPLIGGTVDLGALATEFLILGLDPYPRKPGAVFEPLRDAVPDPGPFAALEALKKGRNDP
jgi:hypothetical protein